MKNIISIAISVLLIVALGFFEHFYLDKAFGDFDSEIDTLFSKLESDALTENDVKTAEQNWENVKETLHLIIPHNDIKPFNESFSELKICLRVGDSDNALKELQVLKDLIKSVPQTYKFTLDNIF